MGSKKPQKIEALVVNAIRRLQDIRGSTPREISNYISQEYGVPTSEIRKQVQLALKRGVNYGILQCLKGGSYTCNRDFVNGQPMAGGDGIIEIPCHGRRRRSSGRRRRRRRSSKRRKSRRKSRSRRRYGRRRDSSSKLQRNNEDSDVDNETNKDPLEGNNTPSRKESASTISTISEDGNSKDLDEEDPGTANNQGSDD